MPQFRYKAYDAQGKLESGLLAAETAAAALDTLAARGLTPFSVDDADGSMEVPWWAREFTLVGDTVPRRDLAQFFSGFALLHRARLPVPAALRLASGELSNRRLTALLAQAEREVSEGCRLAEALGGRADLVPARYVALVRIGEEANRLADTTARAAEMLERELAFRSELRSALTYPILLLVASLLVLAALVFFLAPTLAPVFAAVRVEPPVMVRMMISARAFLIGYWPLVVGGGVVITGLVVLLLRNNRAAIQNVLMAAPLIGSILKAGESARVILTLSMMLESGAPMLAALGATRDACTLAAYRDLFAEVEDKVRAGAALSEALAGSPLIPRVALQMIRIGEQSDRLNEMLESAGKTLDAQLHRRIQGLLRILTPALTIIIGAIVGALIFSTLTAILDINDLAL